MIVSVPIIDKNRSDKFITIQYYQVYNVHANADKASIRIVCQMYTVNLCGTQSDLVA